MNIFLLVGGSLSFIVAILHLGCILFGASWYRFFGAGEEMAKMSEAGSWTPTVMTSGIVLVLFIWSLYAFSAAGLIARLPLIKLALCLITGIYLLRGIVFYPLMKHFPDNSLTFWFVSSAICLSFGLIHLIGLVQVWSKLN